MEVWSPNLITSCIDLLWITCIVLAFHKNITELPQCLGMDVLSASLLWYGVGRHSWWAFLLFTTAISNPCLSQKLAWWLLFPDPCKWLSNIRQLMIYKQPVNLFLRTVLKMVWWGRGRVGTAGDCPWSWNQPGVCCTVVVSSWYYPMYTYPMSGAFLVFIHYM